MAKDIDILKFSSDELSTEKLRELVAQKRSFQVAAVKDISYVVNKLEGEIEKQNLRCRVYTEYRTAAIAGVVVPTGVTQLAGIATAIGVGLHNLATINPDYEIAKNQVMSTVTATYQKE